MSYLSHAILFLGFALAGAIACAGRTASVEDGTSALGAPGCEASPPPEARCRDACPYGFKGAAGTHTCECCAAPTSNPTCGGPPPNARCFACPKGYKQVDGRPTCQCCD